MEQRASSDRDVPMGTAMVNCLGSSAPLGVGNELLPLAGRALLQRTIEVLVRAGVREIILVGGTGAMETALGDGARWGCRLRYADVRDGEAVGDLCRRLGLEDRGRYLFADACTLPNWTAAQAANLASLSYAGAAWTCLENGHECWTGWAGFCGSWLLTRRERLDDASFPRAVLRSERIVRFTVGELLRCATTDELLAANRTLLAAASADAPTVGRGCRVHSGARLVAPVYLGDNVEVGDGAVVGPHASLGDGAMVGRNCTVRDAVIGPRTYLGNGLNVSGGAAAGTRYANARLDVVLQLNDQHLLSPATPAVPRGWGLRGLAHRLRGGSRQRAAATR